ncbi:hypothetical protein MPTK1_1g17280 [Marchantia polymorpha subsp. ruderalis]|uniref:Uncharacterized protein n=2 Tax=Marchantia polymorpha TaxID=3197 RepID=A0AAF6AR61_MARPO|nr:hypothetical protein MARPO_0001s0068 [Marchantia polymorpha]BBM98931.1 hypothetical protein Mp_1g17280 [Marchantia polymorpha subsp. ruderalis]|eukprot:PTQ50007.1 hypothetical protein MARPO_0001s0068 [Marchantia polymorpha]
MSSTTSPTTVNELIRFFKSSPSSFLQDDRRLTARLPRNVSNLIQFFQLQQCSFTARFVLPSPSIRDDRKQVCAASLLANSPCHLPSVTSSTDEMFFFQKIRHLWSLTLGLVVAIVLSFQLFRIEAVSSLLLVCALLLWLMFLAQVAAVGGLLMQFCLRCLDTVETARSLLERRSAKYMNVNKGGGGGNVEESRKEKELPKPGSNSHRVLGKKRGKSV